MSDVLLSLYHHMPWRLRTIAASLRGRQLQRLRYGPHTDALVEAALLREEWSTEKWQQWREERLGFVLHRAATKVPYYAEMWAERRRKGDRSSWDQLENWPVLSKQTLRANSAAFVADDCDRSHMVHDHTSGTTGTSLSVWLSRKTVQEWYALFEARWRRWYGVSRHDRWAIVGGQLVTPVANDRPPFWVWNSGMNQLYMSSYHLSPKHVGVCLDALVKYKVRYILGYSSSLYSLALGALEAGRNDVQLKVAITNAEPLLAYQREAIEKAFGCAARETYGMGEAVAAASECEARSLHLWPEAGVVEVFDGNEISRPGTAGDLVCTGLLNHDMPLVRYRVGDAGMLSTDSNICACGRSLPRLHSLEGRSDDVLYTRAGRRVGRLDPVFKGGLPVREAQIVQETLDRVRVRFVPASGYRNSDGQTIISRLRDRMGDVEVILDSVESIPRTRNGKFRAVVCEIPMALRPGDSPDAQLSANTTI